MQKLNMQVTISRIVSQYSTVTLQYCHRSVTNKCYLKFITEFLLDCSSFVVNILPANINKKCCEQQLFMACKVTRGRERERDSGKEKQSN